jgi:hypothetical protein
MNPAYNFSPDDHGAIHIYMPLSPSAILHSLVLFLACGDLYRVLVGFGVPGFRCVISHRCFSPLPLLLEQLAVDGIPLHS